MSVADSKKGRIFLSDLESEKKKELERRRKLRIQQVREQSKDLANVIRKKVQSEKENEENRFKKAESIALQQYHETKLKRLEELYRHCLEDVGDSHIQAAREPNAELVLKALQAQNAAEALVRGEEAKRRQEEMLLEQKVQKEAPVKQKKVARAKEDIRSALIVRLPPTRDKVKSKPDSTQSSTHKSDSPEISKSVSGIKSNQHKIQILQEIPSNIKLQKEDENRITQGPDKNKGVEDTRKSYNKEISASTHKISTNRWSSGDCESKDTCSCTYSCNCHIGSDVYSKRINENKVSSDRGYHSDGDYDSAVRGPHQHCTKKQKPCYCKIKYYDHSNHFQSQYKRLNPVTPHHDTDAVSSAADLLDEKAVSEKNKRLQENIQKCQSRGREAIRRQLAKQKFQKLLKELSALDREERIARCKSLISNVNMGESLRRAALDAKQQKMDMAFEKVLYSTTPSRSVFHDHGNMNFPRVIQPAGRHFSGDSPPATLNVADWRPASSHSSSQSFHPFYHYSKYPPFVYHSPPPAPQYHSPPVHHRSAAPIVNHAPPSPAPPSAPPQPPVSQELPPPAQSVPQINEDEEETLNAIFQRIDHHRKVLLGESVEVGTLSDQKDNPNKRVTLAFSKQFVYSVNPNENKNKVIGDDGVKSSELSDNHTENYNRRRKLSRVRSRSETRKKKLPQTRDHSAQWRKGTGGSLSPSKFDIRIQSPNREHYKVDVDVGPTSTNDNLQIVKKSSMISVDTEVTQGDNELSPFDGVEVTIRVSEKDKNKNPKKIKQRKLFGHEGLRLTKPNKHNKTTDSSTSYYSPPDRITPSQQNLIDALMSHINKRGLSSCLKLHIQNLLSMSRENINDLGISSSDISVDSVYVESVSTKKPVAKDNKIPLQIQPQSTNEAVVVSEELNTEKKELRMEAARKTADIISRYSQLSEMLVKKIENLAKVGNNFNQSFKPNVVSEKSVADLDLSRYPASTADSSYLHLPPEVNPNVPVDRNIMEAFSSGNRYSQLTPTFSELPEPVYFRPTFFVPFQTEVFSKEIPNEQGPLTYYYPNNFTQTVKNSYVPMSNNYYVQQTEMRPQHRETDRRSMPPPTLSNGRFRFGMESSSPPHELTTIPEVDTPGTQCYSDSNIFSDQEEESVIDAFEGLDISQVENDTSSESVNSFDSVSSVPDVVSELIKRNVITSPFENRRKRKVMQVMQSRESQQNLYADGSNKMSPNQEHNQMNTSSAGDSDVRGMLNSTTRKLSGGNHLDFESMSIPPVEYINYRLETEDTVNPFTGLNNKVNNLENGSSFKSVAKSVSLGNITCEEVIEVNNAKQPDVAVSSANEQAINFSKDTFNNNVYYFPDVDKHTESLVKKGCIESRVGYSDIENERLAKFHEILRDLDEAQEIMSDSSPEDLELAFHSIGVGWAGTTLRKTREAQELNSGSTSGASEDVGRPAKLRIKEQNVFSNWRNVEEDLTPPNISLRAPVLVSASNTNLKKFNTRKYTN